MSEDCGPEGFLDFIERNSAGHDDVAITERGTTYTYGELIRAANRWKRILGPLIREGEVVAVDYVEDAFSHTSILLAVMAAGGVHISARRPYQVWSRLKKIGEPWHVLSRTSLITENSSACTVIDLDTGRTIAQQRSDITSSVSEDVRGRILETSGSSGEPKWVYWTEIDLLNDRLEWVKDTGLTVEDVVFNMHPLDFGHGVDVHILPALCAGATVAQLSGPFVPAKVYEELARTRATYMSALPSHYEAIAANAPGVSTLGGHLAIALTGGALLSENTARDLYERCGISLRRLYGATEAGIMCADLGDYCQVSPALTPMGGVEMVLVPLPGIDFEVHKVAEPHFRRKHMFVRYWADAERTQKALSGGWYASGDAVKVADDGSISVLGRAEDVWVDEAKELRSASELLDAYSQVPEIEEVVVFSPKIHPSRRPTVVCRLSPQTGCLKNVQGEANEVADKLGTNPRLYFVSDWPKTYVGKPNRRVLMAWASAD